MKKVAYFSKEFGVKASIPTYAGGLGILAGDTSKSAADLGLDFVGVTLLYDGFFRQHLDENGWQTEVYEQYFPDSEMSKLLETVDVEIEGRKVHVGCWRYDAVGRAGKVPIYFLTTNVEGNAEWDRRITSSLYPADPYYKLTQNVVLGIGGLRLLRKLGYDTDIFHINESSPALVASELLKEFGEEGTMEKCVFTSHTTLPHGNEEFEYSLVRQITNHQLPPNIGQFGGENVLSLMRLAANLSRYRNTVSRKATEVLNGRLGYQFDCINNGVHSFTWTAPELQELFDETIPEWRRNPEELGRAVLNSKKLWNAHQAAKKRMTNYIGETTGVVFDPETLTIGFARRASNYKQMDLLFSDIRRLLEVARGKVQLVFAGKAHPNDMEGKRLIYNVIQTAKVLRREGVPVVYLPDYNMSLAELLTAGVDVWLNTPVKPLEASGTSGMKAAHNGVPQLSTLDGWWIEGWEECKTGWCIGDLEPSNGKDADDLYQKLSEMIIPMYYHDRKSWLNVMRGSITHNASYFNTHRMIREYYEKAYEHKELVSK